MRQIIDLELDKVYRVVDRYKTDGVAAWSAVLDCTHRINGLGYGRGATMAEIASDIAGQITGREHSCPHCIPNESDQADRLFATTYLGITKAVAAYNGHRQNEWSYALEKRFPELFGA